MACSRLWELSIKRVAETADWDRHDMWPISVQEKQSASPPLASARSYWVLMGLFRVLSHQFMITITMLVLFITSHELMALQQSFLGYMVRDPVCVMLCASFVVC